MIDNVMIPITIVITFVAVVPFLVGDYPMQDLWQQDEITQYVPNNSYETDKYAGVRLAVPKFFINGREPEGRGVDAWSKVIEEELKK